jgi:hypothetical protein
MQRCPNSSSVRTGAPLFLESALLKRLIAMAVVQLAFIAQRTLPIEELSVSTSYAVQRRGGDCGERRGRVVVCAAKAQQLATLGAGVFEKNELKGKERGLHTRIHLGTMVALSLSFSFSLSLSLSLSQGTGQRGHPGHSHS